MKRLFTCLLAALLFVNLTACAIELTDDDLAAIDGILSGEEAGPEETPEDIAPEETPEDIAPEESPEDSAPEEPPEDGGDMLGNLSSAPAYAIYPDYGALDAIEEDGTYTSKEDVALYIWAYDDLPGNFMTKKEARELGWSGGGLDSYADGMCIGGDRFGNYEGNLPDVEGRTYYECDIDTLHASSRGAKRLVFCYETEDRNPQVYYTEDHYETFELVYGDDEPNAYG